MEIQITVPAWKGQLIGEKVQIRDIKLPERSVQRADYAANNPSLVGRVESSVALFTITSVRARQKMQA